MQHRTSLVRSARWPYVYRFPNENILLGRPRGEHRIVLPWQQQQYYRLLGFIYIYIYAPPGNIGLISEQMAVVHLRVLGFASFRKYIFIGASLRLFLYMYVLFDMKVCCVSLFFNFDFCVSFQRIIIIGTIICI